MGLLDGKAALITGAASGFGEAGAMAFAREGARVAVADRDAAKGEAVVRAIREAGGEAVFIGADLTRVAEVERIASEAV